MATGTAGNSFLLQAGQVSLEMEPQSAKIAVIDDVDYVKLEEKVNHGCILKILHESIARQEIKKISNGIKRM